MFYTVSKEDPPKTVTGETSSMVFLQGYLSPGQSLDSRITHQSYLIEKYMGQIYNIGKNIKKNTKIIVNLPHLPIDFFNDIVPFLYLGELIKEQQAELYIVGGCGIYCASYFLPAAKAVYIEPLYGYITTRGNFTGRVKEAVRTRQAWVSERKKQLQGEAPSRKGESYSCDGEIVASHKS